MNVERFLSQRDAATLCRLAEHLLRLRDIHLNHAERLVELISNSILLPEHAKRTDCVSLYAQVTYRRIGTSDARTVAVVCPQDMNETLARLSILTPLALALIGRGLGNIVEVARGAQRIEYVEILAIQHASPCVSPVTATPLQPTTPHGETYVLQRRRSDQLPFIREGWPRYGT